MPIGLPRELLKMSLIVAEQSVGPITLLELGERFTADSIEELRDCLEKLELQGRQLLLFDCGRITLIDSLGVGALVRNWVSQRKRGGSLKLLRPSPRMREVLQTVGLSKLIESFDNVEDALRSF
jgi:anti-anti-sigma factor